MVVAVVAETYKKGRSEENPLPASCILLSFMSDSQIQRRKGGGEEERAEEGEKERGREKERKGDDPVAPALVVMVTTTTATTTRSVWKGYHLRSEFQEGGERLFSSRCST